MNTRERFVKTLTGEKVDRVPFMKVFGGESDYKRHTIDQARKQSLSREEPYAYI